MYSCPNCGGRLLFHIPTQDMMCDHCETHFDPAQVTDQHDAEEHKEYNVTIFTCPQCGGEIMSTDETISNFCTYCGASTVLTSRLSKEKKPSYIIPFQKTKDDCKQAYGKLMRHALFAPKELKDPAYVDEFRGIYMPYWAFFEEQKGPSSLHAEKSYRKGDYVYTDHYRLDGDLNCTYKGISYDASSSFADNISEKIAPYDVRNMNNFSPAYLSGFYADRSDVPSDVYKEDAKSFADEETTKYLRKMDPYRSYDITDNKKQIAFGLHTRTAAVDSALYPVWLLSYRKKDRVAYATVNGQTGKVAADLPMSIGKYFIGSLILAAVIFFLMNLGITFRPAAGVVLASLFAVISMVVYLIEVRSLGSRDSGLSDKGLQSKINPAGEKLKSQSGKGCANGIIVGCGTIWFVFLIISMAVGIFSSIVETGVGFIIANAVLLVIGLLVFAIGNSQRKKLTELRQPIGVYFILIVLVASLALQILHPVSDLYYYGVMILTLIAVAFFLMQLMKIYNYSATRKLPQFERYQGGDDRG